MTTQFIDLTMDLQEAFTIFTPQSIDHFSPQLIGHVGTHIDIMDTPGLDAMRFISKAHIIEVEGIFDREISLNDCQFNALDIQPMDSIVFKTNWSKKMLPSRDYFKNHPYLHTEVVDYLLCKQINLIAIDAPGIKRGQEHRDIDQYCADKGVYVVENLINLEQIKADFTSILYCFPINHSKNTGVTCRVVLAQETIPQGETN